MSKKIIIIILIIIAAVAGVIYKTSMDNSNNGGSEMSKFQSIQKGMTEEQVFGLVGQPQADIGSGIHIYKYVLSNNATMLVGVVPGTGVLYVRSEKDGKTETLIGE